MGVSGAGKTTLAQALAAKLGWDFQEGDAFHSADNLRKMASGLPLTVADRTPWLARVKTWIDSELASGRCGFVTCSALKRRYRDYLVAGRDSVRLLYLEVGRTALAERMTHRVGHFMPATLLRSQLETFERPEPSERPIVIRAENTVEAALEAALSALGDLRQPCSNITVRS